MHHSPFKGLMTSQMTLKVVYEDSALLWLNSKVQIVMFGAPTLKRPEGDMGRWIALLTVTGTP